MFFFYRAARYVLRPRRRCSSYRRCQSPPRQHDWLAALIAFLGVPVIGLFTLAAAELTHSGATAGWVMLLGFVAWLILIVAVTARDADDAPPLLLPPEPAPQPALPEPTSPLSAVGRKPLPQAYYSNRR